MMRQLGDQALLENLRQCRPAIKIRANSSYDDLFLRVERLLDLLFPWLDFSGPLLLTMGI